MQNKAAASPMPMSQIMQPTGPAFVSPTSDAFAFHPTAPMPQGEYSFSTIPPQAEYSIPQQAQPPRSSPWIQNDPRQYEISQPVPDIEVQKRLSQLEATNESLRSELALHRAKIQQLEQQTFMFYTKLAQIQEFDAQN